MDAERAAAAAVPGAAAAAPVGAAAAAAVPAASAAAAAAGAVPAAAAAAAGAVRCGRGDAVMTEAGMEGAAAAASTSLRCRRRGAWDSSRAVSRRRPCSSSRPSPATRWCRCRCGRRRGCRARRARLWPPAWLPPRRLEPGHRPRGRSDQPGCACPQRPCCRAGPGDQGGRRSRSPSCCSSHRAHTHTALNRSCRTSLWPSRARLRGNGRRQGHERDDAAAAAKLAMHARVRAGCALAGEPSSAAAASSRIWPPRSWPRRRPLPRSRARDGQDVLQLQPWSGFRAVRV